MKQFWVLLKKELGSYFKSYFAYITFGAYLFISIGAAFYFGSYFDMKDASGYSVFYLQPFILSIFLPAVTMRTWSEEYKSGTAEFLLTQPVSFLKLVSAKVAASGLFGFLMAFFLLPFIMYTGTWLATDWGNVACAFLGVFLLILLLCSLGCFISSLNRQIIMAYLLTVVTALLVAILPFTKLYECYSNWLFAQVGPTEFFYFLSLSGLLVFLNVLVLEYRFSAQRHKNIRFGIFCVLAFVGMIVLNAAGWLLFDDYKHDFTSYGQYTPQRISEETVAKIKEPLYIDVFAAKDYLSHSPENYYYYQQVKRFLRKYQILSRGMIRLRVTEVEAFSEMEKEVLNNGLFYEDNSRGTKDYFGAVIHNDKGEGLTIRQFISARKDYLEQDVDKVLLRFTDSFVIKNIGVYLDPLQRLEDFQAFMLNLENDYNIITVKEDTYEISPKLDMLILVNPKNISTYFMYAIDQYILRGGKVLMFVDAYTEGQTELTNSKKLRILSFFDAWNIVIQNKLAEHPEVAKKFAISKFEPDLYRAFMFDVQNDDFKVEPFIKAGEFYIGALVKGPATSIFFGNPHNSVKILQNMLSFKAKTENMTVGIVGDVDILTDHASISEESPDFGPYGVIAKSANGEVVRRFIDYMLDNQDYLNLPLKKGYENGLSVAGQIGKAINEEYQPIYESLLDNIENSQRILRKSEGVSDDKMSALKKAGSAAASLSSLEQQADNILYQMRKTYFKQISKIIVLWCLLYPVAVGLLLRLVVCLLFGLKKRVIKGKYYE